MTDSTEENGKGFSEGNFKPLKSKMPTGRPCAVCNHLRRESIENDCLNGKRVAAISVLYGVGASSIRGHFKKHLSKNVEKGFNLRRLSAARSLSERVELLLVESVDILEKAREGEVKDRVIAARQVRDTLDLVGRLSGQLSTLNVFFVKHSIRDETELERMVTSYRQDAAVTPEMAEHDAIEVVQWLTLQDAGAWGRIVAACAPKELNGANGNGSHAEVVG